MKIGSVNVPDSYLILGAVVGVALFFGPQLAGWLTRRTAAAAGGIVVQGTQGAVLGIAESLGIPDTSVSKCSQYLQAGDYWNASFYCPAGAFLKSASGAVYNAATGQKVGTVAPSSADDIVSIKPYNPVGLPGVPGSAPAGEDMSAPLVIGGVLQSGASRELIR